MSADRARRHLTLLIIFTLIAAPAQWVAGTVLQGVTP